MDCLTIFVMIHRSFVRVSIEIDLKEKTFIISQQARIIHKRITCNYTYT